jgi:transposase
MIALTPHIRVLLARDAVDFRCGIDGLAGLCKSQLASDPFSGVVFAFRNRAGTAIKLLVYDGQGFWLCHKRLSSGRFRHWPKGDEIGLRLMAQELQVLLSNGNPLDARIARHWKEVK